MRVQCNVFMDHITVEEFLLSVRVSAGIYGIVNMWGYQTGTFPS